MPHFLCAQYLREHGLRSKARKQLAMLLQAGRLHAPSNVRAKLFAEAAGLLAFAFEQPTCELVFHAIVVLYGESAAQVVLPPPPAWRADVT